MSDDTPSPQPSNWERRSGLALDTIQVLAAELDALQAKYDALARSHVKRLEQLTYGGRNLRVRVADFMPTTKFALVQMTNDVVDIVDGQRPTIIPFTSLDGFTVRGPSAGSQPSGGVANARHDHRMAMAFAIAALGARAPSTIEGADVVAISYPGFFETLDRLVTPLDRLGAP